MKRSMLSIAIAAAAVSSAAHAFDPVTTAPDYTVVISGATAPEATLADIIVSDICTSNIDKFSYASTTHYAIACHVNNSIGKVSGLPPSGRNILFLKNSGGSGTGAGALQNHVPVSVQGPVHIADCTGHASASVNSVSYANNTGCASNITTMVPDWGISDVEPTIFVDNLAPPDAEGGAFDPNGPTLVVKPLSQLGFGVDVTLSFYRALQAVQFPTTGPTAACNPLPAAGTDTNGNGINDAYEVATSDAIPAGASHKKGDTAACMPTLSRQEVAQLLKGSITSLNQLSAGTTSLPASTAVLGKPWAPASNTINVCRRTTGSGTHAVTSMFFLGSQCSDNGRFISDEDGSRVFANTSSGDMDNCLDAFETGGTAAASLPVPVPAGAAHRFAVGYNSVEKNANLGKNYRFIKVDGRAPSLVEIHDANYLETGAETMQTRGVGDPAVSGDYVTAPSSDTAGVTSMFNWVAAQMTNPAFIATLNGNAKFLQPFGNSGFLASPSSSLTPDRALSSARPVGTFKRQEGTADQNSCLEPQVGVANTGFVPVDK